MRLNRRVGPLMLASAVVLLSGCRGNSSMQAVQAAAVQGNTPQMPQFEYDPTWPKQLPNKWMFGEVGAMVTDPKTNHIWVLQRPSGGAKPGLGDMYGLDGIAECCFP